MRRALGFSFGLVMLLSCATVFAQNSGSIQGTVTDSAGAVIAGAKVQATDEAKGAVIREVTSGADGAFALRPLQAGTYTVSVEATGMKKAVRTGLVLDPSQVLGLGEVKMEVGAISETMTVEAVQPLVETDTSDHSSVIDHKQVTELSMNGRDFQTLMRTIPGVVTNDTTDFRLSFNNTDAFHVNGMRGSANNAFLDGAVNTDPGANDGQYTQISLDAVGEFKIQTSNFSAEYGRNAGVLISANTKSGGKQYHGTLYEFNREDGFDASPFGGSKSELRYNNFGGNIGGPIPLGHVKDKLFFFYNFEGTRAIRPGNNPYPTQNNGSAYDLPDPAELTGDFTTSYRAGQLGVSPYQIGQIFVPGSITYDPATGQIANGTPICGTPAAPCNIIPTSQFSSQAAAIIKFVTPAYRGGGVPVSGSPDRVRIPFHDVYRFRKNQNVVRVDFNPTAKTNVFFRWVDDSQRESDQGGLFGFSDYPILPEFRKKPGSSWEWNLVNVIRPTITNEFIFSYNHLTQAVDIDSTVPKSYYDRTALGFTFQELFTGPNIRNRFPDLGPCCQGNFTGAQFPPFWHSEARTFTFTDNVTKVAGAHTIKFGAFFDYNQAGQQPSWQDAPQFNFGTGSSNPNDSANYVANMLLGNYSTVSQSNGVFFGAFRFHQVEAFGQDTWKVNHKLTLDLGLRWAYLGPTYTVQPFFQNYFDPSRYNPANAITLDTTPGFSFGSICSASSTTAFCQSLPSFGDPFNGIRQEGNGIPLGGADHHYNNFGPRFGFAYDPWGDGKTAIRGGFGLFFERIRQNINSFDALGNPPLTYRPVIPANAGPTGNIDALNPGLVSGLRFPVGLNAFDQKGQIPKTYSVSLGVQRELPWRLALDVAYVGNRTRHLQYQYNAQALPVGSQLSPSLPSTFYANFLGYSAIGFTKYGANSSYDSLQSKVSRRFGRGLFLSADYTWAKAIDLQDSDNGNQSGLQITDPFNLHSDYARAGFDRKHVFNFNYVYTIPFHQTGALRYLLGGWEVSGVTRFQSGVPLDITSNGNAGNFVGVVRPDFSGGSVYVNNKPLAGISPGNGGNHVWFNPFLFTQPVPGSVGGVRRYALTGPGINNWDISLFKNVKFTESMSLQLRLESFNTFNHTQPASVNTAISTPGPGLAPSTGTVGSSGTINGYRSPRNVQLGVKLYF